jgi:hypothetical protein
MGDDNELPTLKELDESDAQRRALSFELSLDSLRRVLDPSDKIARLEAISDEEWQAAVEADEEAEGA